MRPFDEPPEHAMPGEPGEPGEPEGPELIGPDDFLTVHAVPADARRLGLDRNTEEGAMIALAGALDPAKTSHKVIAWVLLGSFFSPLLVLVLQYLL